MRIQNSAKLFTSMFEVQKFDSDQCSIFEDHTYYIHFFGKAMYVTCNILMEGVEGLNNSKFLRPLKNISMPINKNEEIKSNSL